MSDVPRHEHRGLFALIMFVLVYAIVWAGVLVYVAPRAHHWVERSDLRCSAFVTPPKGCKP